MISGAVLIDGVDVIAEPKAIDKVRGKTLALIPQDPMTALSPVHSIGSQLRGHRGCRVQGQGRRPAWPSACWSRSISRRRTSS